MTKPSSNRRLCKIMRLIRQAPRTPVEIIRLLDVSAPESVYANFKLLKEEGLVYIGDWRKGGVGKNAPEYFWQPSPFEMRDVPHPTKRKVAA